jgi:predicted O-linked N-acetylglucosamine transferase (SPINDLY family)
MSSLLEEAILLHKKGQLKEAEKLYKSILKSSSSNFEVIHLLGIIKIQLKQFEEAIVWLNKAISINPNNHSVFNNLGVCYKELKKYNEALNNFQNAIKIKSDYAEAYNNLAIIYKSLENYEEAIKNYNKSIKLKPEYAESYNNLGIIYLNQEKFDAAKDLFEQAIKIKPNYAEAYYNLGNIYKKKKNYDYSIKYYNLALELKKNYAEAVNNLGTIYLNQEKFDAAKDLFEQAIKIKPNYADAVNNLGIVYLNQEKFDAAKDLFEQAIKIKPNYTETINNLGIVNLNQEKFDAAKDLFEQAIKIKPSYFEAVNNLGIVYLNQEKFDAAKDLFEQAIKMKHDYAEAYCNLGLVFLKLNDVKTAKFNIEKAIFLNDSFQNAYVALGSYYNKIEDYENAETSYKKAIEIKGKDVSLHLSLFYAGLGNFEDSEKILSGLINLNPRNANNYYYRSIIYNNKLEFRLSLLDLERAFKIDDTFYKSSNKVFMLLCARNKFCEWASNKTLKYNLLKITKKEDLKHLDAFGLFAILDDLELTNNITFSKIEELTSDTTNEVLDINFNINKNKKIKVGYFSPDFQEHPVGYIVSELFSCHDKDKFEITGFSLNPNQKIISEIRNKIINNLDNFVECGKSNYREIVEKSRNFKIDLAIDLAGFTANSKIKSFIKRVAPLQVNYLGYPGTLGPSFDYIIADLEVIPIEKQKFYSEKIIYMPETFLPSFTKFDLSSNITKESIGLKKDNFVFVNFNTHHKITPFIFNVWMRILKKIKNGVLYLSEGNEYSRENLKKEAINRGVAAERIIFSKTMDYSTHVIKYKFCDLFLDTFPYNAHSTASSSLLSGCPLITIRGESFHARVSSSILSSLNLRELICDSIEEYENKIINMAQSPKDMDKIKKKLNDSLIKLKIFDTNIYVKNLEKAYNKIYEKYHQKVKPENIFIK